MNRAYVCRQMLSIIGDDVLPHLPPELLLEIAAVTKTNRYADFVTQLAPYEDTTQMLLLKAWALFCQVQEGIHIDDIYLDMLQARSLFNEALARDNIDDILSVAKRKQYRANFNPELARVKRFAIKHNIPLEPPNPVPSAAPLTPSTSATPVKPHDKLVQTQTKGWFSRWFKS